jgi:hypothetical protein
LIICCADLSVQYTLAASSGAVQAVRWSKSITLGSLADFMLSPVVPVGLFSVCEHLAADAATVDSAHRHNGLSLTSQAVLLARHGADCFNHFFVLNDLE